MIRTVEQYLKSLEDGQSCLLPGREVKDVRTHPMLGTIIRSAAMDFAMPQRSQIPRPIRDQRPGRRGRQLPADAAKDIGGTAQEAGVLRPGHTLRRRLPGALHGCRCPGRMPPWPPTRWTCPRHQLCRARRELPQIPAEKRCRPNRRHDRRERRPQPASLQTGPA